MGKHSKALQGLEKALTASGGTTALTRALGCSKSVVGNWRRAGGIPVAKAPDVSRVTGLPLHVLRPDVFTERLHAGFEDQQAPLEGLAAHASAEARALGLDPDAIAAAALRKAIADEKARRWQDENREAIDAWNKWTDENELPLAKHRMF